MQFKMSLNQNQAWKRSMTPPNKQSKFKDDKNEATKNMNRKFYDDF